MPAVFLTAEWRDLVMLNYEVEPSLLRERVPVGTELDVRNGRTFVSVVAFRFLRTRLRGVPIPFHRNFGEVNLRFYVRRRTPDGVKRGVVFIKELVPRRAIAWVARWWYNENYVAVPIRYATHLPPADASETGTARYEWRVDGRWNQLSVDVEGPAEMPDLDSEEAFITEHYWGYTRQRDGSTIEYQVEHPRWKVWRAASAELDCDVAALYGEEFVGPLSAEPSSAFIAEGSDVAVRCAVPVTGSD